MKKILSLSLISLAVLSGCGTGSPETQPVTLQAPVVQAQSQQNEYLVREIRSKLNNIEYFHLNKLPYQDRMQALDKLQEVYYMLDRLGGYPSGSPMSPRDFDALLDEIKKATFDREKLEILTFAAKTNRFNVEQVLTMFSLWTFDSEKLKILEIMYPKVVDKNYSYKILNYFDFSTTKQKAKAIMDRYPANSQNQDSQDNQSEQENKNQTVETK